MTTKSETMPAEATPPAQANGSAGPQLVLLSAAEILGANDIAHEIVEVPEWKGAVMVYGLTGDERDEFEGSLSEKRGKSYELVLAHIRAKLCSLAIRDEHGKRLFTDTQVEALGRKSASALQRVFSVAQRLSGMTDEDVDELANDLGKGQSAASGSA